jgi:hypothetical protein
MQQMQNQRAPIPAAHLWSSPHEHQLKRIGMASRQVAYITCTPRKICVSWGHAGRESVPRSLASICGLAMASGFAFPPIRPPELRNGT